MNIVDKDGQTRDVTSAGQGLYNTIAGSIGALGALGSMGNGGLLSGLFGGNNGWRNGGNGCGGGYGYGYVPHEIGEWVNRYEMNQAQALALKDAEIARLQSEATMRQNMVEVYAQLNKVDNQTRDRIDAMGKELLDKITVEREARLIAEKEQAVFNQSMVGTTSTMAQQLKSLQNVLNEITTNVVPANKVCATGCCCGN